MGVNVRQVKERHVHQPDGSYVKEKLPEPYWAIVINHKGKRKFIKVGSSREAAVLAARKIEEGLATDRVRLRSAKETVTLKAYAERWMEQGKMKWKPATLQNYQYFLDDFILPAFGSTPIDELRRDELKAHCSHLLEKTYKRTQDGEAVPYGKATVHNVIRVLSALLTEAKEEGLVTENIALRPGKVVKRDKFKPDVLNEREQDLLLSSTQHHYPADFPLILLLHRSMMRKGELRGLQWGDIDWAGKFIRVSRTFSKKNLGTPKSGSSRNVEIGDYTLSELRRHQANLMKRWNKKGKPLPVWVFPARHGQPLADERINIIHSRCLEKAGLRHITVHAARHSTATQHIQDGAPIAWAQQQLGHSTIMLTVDTYGSHTQSSNRKAVGRRDKPVDPQTVSQTEDESNSA